jgi:cytochrome P450
MFAGPRFLEACRRRYGGAVWFRTVFDGGFVMLFDPELVKQLFRGSNDQLHAGEANALLGPVLGERSVLLLDGSEHLRHRRLMLPAFHGSRLKHYEQTMVEAADAEIDSWPLGTPFELLPSMQSLTLRVIMRAVFGYEAGAAEDDLRERLRAMIEPLARPRGLMILALANRLSGRRMRARQQAAADRFAAGRDAVDRLLYAEIARRRAEPEQLVEREDVFSALLQARDEDGRELTDKEVRDELVTLLLAGHETTATGLAWTFDLLLHSPEVLERARRAAAGEEVAAVTGDAYLDAVVKEALRLRPVIPGVGRVVQREPFSVNGWSIPPGVEINPSIRMIHWRGDLYPEPQAFRPERFLGENPPDTYTWVPFGGGTRRCLGASFAQTEMRLVLQRVLERAVLRAADPKRDRIQFRAITLAPRAGARAVVDRRL